MGMSASQARLLSITARMSDNENCAQSVSYSKQRLADETQQLNTAYNEAQNATKLTVITGYKNGAATYTDISYNLLTDSNMLSGKQYVVTDAKNRLLVDEKIAKAFEKGNGDFNVFLAEMGYSQSDMAVQFRENITTGDDDYEDQMDAQQKVHEAWDTYFATIGINLGDIEHDGGKNITFEYINTTNGGYASYVENGVSHPINYEGTTKEQREFFDYANAITNAYYNGDTYTNEKGTVTLKTAADANNNDMLKYYRNLFNRMQSGDYFAYTTTLANTVGENGKHYEYVQDLAKTPIKDNSLFEKKLKEGALLLESFSTNKEDFVSASLGADQTIVEVADERAIARAERQYEQDLTALENKDKKFDLELNKLDTEHNALQTEYDSVKNVIDKNVEKTFNVFS